MYREPRGSIYHPHREETITLGTLMVEEYERPAWTYNKLVYIEKEGFTEALKDNGWSERHDCMLMSSKGFTTRAARDLVDKLAKHDEPVTVFCVHDADAYGTMIYQTFQEATRNNPMNQNVEARLGNLRRAARCRAKTRAGTPCECPAIRGRARCRLHGGRADSSLALGT